MRRSMRVLCLLACTTLLIAVGTVAAACGAAGAPTAGASAAGTPPSMVIARPSVTTATPTTEALPAVLEVDVAVQSNAAVSHDLLIRLRDTIAHRVSALGITNAVVGIGGNAGLVVELPSPVPNPQAVVQTLTATGLLEIIDDNGQYLPVGTVVSTTGGGPAGASRSTPSASTGPVYQTIVTGADLSETRVTTNQLGQQVVEFTLTPQAAQTFYAFTSTHIGQPMSIVLDKRVIETATIQSGIRDKGQISGVPGLDIRALAAELTTGTLPVPVVVSGSRILSDQLRVVGP